MPLDTMTQMSTMHVENTHKIEILNAAQRRVYFLKRELYQLIKTYSNGKNNPIRQKRE
jgi:hypothetical protein